MGMGDTARFNAAIKSNGGWPMFISVVSVVLVVLGLSITAAYKASATESQAERNSEDIQKLQQYGERITRIEVTVESIQTEQAEMKDTQEDIKTNTTDILIELKAIQRADQIGNTQ